MDKELLRIAIIGTGLIIMVVMIVSAYLKNKHTTEEDYEEDEDFEYEFEEEDIEEESVKKQSLTQTLKSVYSKTIQKNLLHQNQKIATNIEKESIDVVPTDEKEHHNAGIGVRSSSPPAIIQFSVITKGQDDFNVADVFHVLEGLGLEYGSMKIFERVDENRFVHFGVASMNEPGTFPDENLENFYCSGVVFFMQIDDLENPKLVFDDYVDTAVHFAHEMNGMVLDHRRQLLTREMVDAIRAAM